MSNREAAGESWGSFINWEIGLISVLYIKLFVH